VAYRATLTPSAELAEEWRETKLARADERFRVLGPRSLGKRDEAGAWIEEPDYQALAALQREEDAISKMLGANLEAGATIGLLTREYLAELVWRDEPAAIEGTAEEIDEPDHSE